MCTLCGDDNESDSPSRKKINDVHSDNINKHDTPSGDEGDVKETDPLIKNCKWQIIILADIKLRR